MNMKIIASTPAIKLIHGDNNMIVKYKPLILLGILLVAAFSAAASAETISLTPASSTIYKGYSTTFQITLDSAPAGISGYYMEISLATPAVAEITGVTYPPWVSVNETIGVPSDLVTIAGIDLGEQVQAGATNIPIGSFTVRGDNAGTSNVVLQVLKFDADGDDIIDATVNDAAITVLTSSSGGGSLGGGGSSGDYPVPSSTTATTATSQVTTLPTSSTVETDHPPSFRLTGSETPVVSQETTVAPPVPADSYAGSLPIPLPWIVVIVIILVIAAAAVLYLVLTRRI